MRQFILYSLLVAASSLAPLAQAHASEDWSYEMGRSGVKVYSRSVEGSKVSEIRALANFAMSPDQILAVLADVEAWPSFVPTQESVVPMHREGDTAWLHVVINPPVINRRDYCTRITIRHLPNGIKRSEWQLDEAHCPARHAGWMPMKANRGYWQLTPNGTGTDVEYVAHADPGADISGSIVGQMTMQAIPGMFDKLRKRVAAQPVKTALHP